MSNVIQIKRGAGVPADGILLNGELGYNTSNGTLLIGNTAKKATQIKLREYELLAGGGNYAGDYSVIDQALIPDLSANRFAFLDDGVVYNTGEERVKCEWTRDGSTWTEHTSEEFLKRRKQLFSSGCTKASCFFLGNANTTSNSTTNSNYLNKYRLRVTINCLTANIYTTLNKFVIYGNIGDCTECYCSIATTPNSSTETWTTIVDRAKILGSPGFSVINLNQKIVTVNGASDKSRVFKIRFEFWAEAKKSNASDRGFGLMRLEAYGGIGHSTPSTLAKNGHLYSYDYNAKATFPGELEVLGETTTLKSITATAITATSITANGAINLNNGTFTVTNQTTSSVSGSGENAITTTTSGTVKIGTNLYFQGIKNNTTDSTNNDLQHIYTTGQIELKHVSSSTNLNNATAKLFIKPGQAQLYGDRIDILSKYATTGSPGIYLKAYNSAGSESTVVQITASGIHVKNDLGVNGALTVSQGQGIQFGDHLSIVTTTGLQTFNCDTPLELQSSRIYLDGSIVGASGKNYGTSLPAAEGCVEGTIFFKVVS